MSPEIWLAYVVATTILLVIPGPTILLVMSYSLAHGARVRWPLVAAVGLGDATALAVSLLGLGALLAASAFWFSVVKWVGGLYLIYLGAKLLFSRSAPVALPAAGGMQGRRETWKLALNCYVVTALNPKGIVFFIAFLPQFVDANAPAGPQLWILSLTFLALAVINAALYAVFASAARRFLDSPRAQLGFNRVGGALLVLAGLWALTARRAA